MRSKIKKSLLLFFALVSLGVVFAEQDSRTPPFASATVDGLTMFLTPPMVQPRKLTRHANGEDLRPSSELKDWEMFWQIVLRNDGAGPIQVITASANGPTKGLRGDIDYSYSVPRVRGNAENSIYVKPKPSELDIVTLKPGEVTLLGAIQFSYDHDVEGNMLVFSYRVHPYIKRYYEVWTGSIIVKVPYDKLVGTITPAEKDRK